MSNSLAESSWRGTRTLPLALCCGYLLTTMKQSKWKYLAQYLNLTSPKWMSINSIMILVHWTWKAWAVEHNRISHKMKTSHKHHTPTHTHKHPTLRGRVAWVLGVKVSPSLEERCVWPRHPLGSYLPLCLMISLSPGDNDSSHLIGLFGKL